MHTYALFILTGLDILPLRNFHRYLPSRISYRYIRIIVEFVIKISRECEIAWDIVIIKIESHTQT